MNKFGTNIRSHLGIYGPASVLVIIGFVVAFQFIKPAPPDNVRMATGDAQGAYHGVAQLYQQYLQTQGIQLELINTAGSLENLEENLFLIDITLTRSQKPTLLPPL